MRQRRAASIWLAFILIPSLVVCLIWLPFGFHLHGLIEEWDVLGLFAGVRLFFAATPHGMLPAHSLRPFTILPQAVGYFLDSDSFLFWHLQLMLALVAKGAATAYLVWFATRRFALALVASALVIVYPADTMQLAFRALHINVALSLALLATCVLLASYDLTCRRASLLGGVAAGALFAIACAMYEATLPLFVLPWLVLFARDGWVVIRLALRLWLPGLAWCGGLAVYLGYAWWASTQAESYQSDIFGGSSVFLTSLPNLFRIGAMRGLLSGWVDAYRISAREYSGYVYLATASVVLLVGIVLAVKLRERRTRSALTDAPGAGPVPTLRQRAWGMVRFLLAGVALTLLGYSPYLMSPSHQMISQRTFLFATPGAVMVWMGVVGLIGLVRPKLLATGLASLLLALGLGAQLYQFHHYVRISMQQDRYLRAIIDALGPMPVGKTLVVLDGTNSMGQTWMFQRGAKLNSALTYFYGHGMAAVEICRTDTWEWERTDDIGRKGTCALDDTNIWLRWPEAVGGPGAPPYAHQVDQVVARDDAVVISLDADGRARRLSPREPGVALLYHRYLGVLNDVVEPWGNSMFLDSGHRDSADSPFGRYWSMEVPVRGVGWREPEWKLGPFKNTATAWKTSQVAVVFLDVWPRGQAYEVTGNAVYAARPDIREKIALSVNGLPLSMTWLDATHFRADVPANALRGGSNAVEFNAPVAADYYGLSFALNDLRIRPVH
ncbi:hypothetical protein ACVWWJ_003860 [Luteibacter sp. HA06]